MLRKDKKGTEQCFNYAILCVIEGKKECVRVYLYMQKISLEEDRRN